MSDSYIFYSSFHEAVAGLPDEQYGKFMRIINTYALTNELPEIEDSVFKMLFTLVKPQIDANYERRVKAHEYGKLGGRPKKNNTEKSKTLPFETENPPFLKNNSNENVNENVNVNVNENENVSTSNTLTLGSSEYSQKVFDVFKGAGLPCNRGNSIAFLQQDFKNALDFMHNTPELQGLHSDDVIQACKNYVEVLQDGTTYLKNRYGFERLVHLKNFKDFLPQNFIHDNFLKFGEQKTAAEQTKKTWFEKCKECGAEALHWVDSSQKYICDGCHKTFSWNEVH